jgi:hypothetical protein
MHLTVKSIRAIDVYLIEEKNQFGAGERSRAGTKNRKM